MNGAEGTPALILRKNGFLLLPGVVTSAVAASLHRYTMKFAESKQATDDDQVPGAVACYGDPVMERMLEGLVPDMERIIGRPLYPTYAYFRVYKKGDVLKRHRDRPACEYTLSLSVGYGDALSWPLYVQGFHGDFSADLKPGDALIFKGLECDHWREPFDGGSCAMVFLHYVDREGPYAEWRFDKRQSLQKIDFAPADED
jgi:hypothetical protein